MTHAELFNIEKRDILRRLAEGEWPSVDWDETRYVACDEPCFALREPVTEEELRAALVHWRDHSFTHRCSHGR